MQINSLVNDYESSSVPVFRKELGKVIQVVNKEIKKFDAYFSKKQYRKINPDADDKTRFNDMLDKVFETIKTKDNLNKYLKSVEYYDKLCNVLKNSYETFSDDFKKSYKFLSIKINRVLNPKKETDNIDKVDELDIYIKNYSTNFNVSNYYLYHSYGDSEKVYELYPIFSLVNGNDTLWVSDKELEMEKICVGEFHKYIDEKDFELNPIHYVNLDTLKRNLMKQDFYKFKKHLMVMPMKFYQTTYKRSSDFNMIDEEKINNSMNGFVKSMEDYANYCFAKFDFEGNVGDIQVKINWCCIKPLDEFMSEDDLSVFDIMEVCENNFIESFNNNGTVGSVYLH